MNDIDFSKYRVNSSDINKFIDSKEQENSEEIPKENINFSKYEVKKEKEPSAMQETGRHLARTGSRIAETVLGLPGDVYQLAKGLSEKIPNIDPEIFKKESNIIKKTTSELGEKLPTSQEIKQFASEYTNGFTDPKGAYEKFGDQITELATALLIPAKNPGSFGNLLKEIGKSIGKSFLAKGAGKTAELYGAGEKGQLLSEIGTLFLTGILSPNTASEFVSGAYEKAKKAIPNGTMLPTSNLTRGLNQVENELNKGLMTPTKEQVLKKAQELKAKASGGAIPAEDIVQSYHDINEIKSSKKLFDELSSTEKKLLNKRFGLVLEEIDKNLKDYGQYNPDFYNQWKEANTAFKAIQESKKSTEWLNSKIKNIPEKLLAGVAIEVLTGHPAIAAATIGAGTTTFVGLRAGQALSQISKSKLLRKYYLQGLRAQAEKNFPAFLTSAKHLQKRLDQEIPAESAK